MIAAKQFDPVVGIDIHIIQPPGPVPPVPVPHPFVGILIDPFDFAPIVGGTVMVNGIPRATAGTGGKCVPPHIPIGGVFVKPPGNECEVFMGSSTVLADGEPLSFLGMPALSCHDIGMPPPPRIKKKKAPKSLFLPTSVVLSVPAGAPVLVGGPPTVSMMALGMKAAMAGFGKAFKKLKKMKGFKKVMRKFKKAKQKAFKNMKPGFLKCNVLKAEPVNVLTGEVVFEQEDFALPWLLPLKWVRHYGHQNRRRGTAGIGWQTPADARLAFSSDGTVAFHDGGPGVTVFDAFPREGRVLEEVDGAALDRDRVGLVVRTKNGLTYHFPASGHPGTEILVDHISDRCGNAISFIRDENGLQGIAESSGITIDVTSRGGIITQMLLLHPLEPSPRVLVSYEFSREGDLIAVRDALENTYRFVYTNHCLVQHSSRTQISFYYEYDQLDAGGKCVHAWGDKGLYDYRFSYDSAPGETRITDSLGHVSRIVVDEAGFPTEEIDALGYATRFEYDDVGRTTAVVDAAGAASQYAYDDRGNLTQLTRPDGQTIIWEYNEWSGAVRISDATGGVWQQGFDSRGLPIRQSTPVGAESEYEYDVHGRLTRFTNPKKASTSFTFDAHGNVARLIDALGRATAFTYNAFGSVTSRVDPLGQITRYEYDAKGRLARVVQPSGSVVSCGYDGDDNLVSYVDENGAVTRLEYTGLGELRRRIQSDGYTVEYHYDTEERLIAVTNQRGERYRFERDPLGRVIEERDYWGQCRRHRYSDVGHLQETVDALGRVTRYETDPIGRVLKKVTAAPEDGPLLDTATFEYDLNGNLTGCENDAIRIERVYDPDGRLVQERQGDAVTVSYAHDANGNCTVRVVEHQLAGTRQSTTTRYEYDLLDQAIAAGVDGHATIQFVRNVIGQITHEQLGSALSRKYSYSPDGLLLQQSVFVGRRSLFAQAYQYDGIGNLVEKQDSVVGVERYTFDPLGRLASIMDPEGVLRRLANDPSGDRLRTRIPPGVNNSSWYREGTHDSRHYRFDRTGSLVERTGPEGTVHFLWDAHQRLRECDADGQTTTYQYDALGRRVSKRGRNTATRFIWDGDTLAADVVIGQTEASASAKSVRQWIHYPQTFEPLALIQSMNGTATAELFFYHNDPNGCPVRLLDNEGQVKWSARYGPWGVVDRLEDHRLGNPLRLQGQYWDAESGLHYNRHRYYEPHIGGFITPDPLGLTPGENQYQYAPNVLGWIDPLGLACRPRSPHPIGRRFRFNTMKEAREAAERASPAGKAVKHIDPKHGPHFHAADAAGRPLNHDHYFFPKRFT